MLIDPESLTSDFSSKRLSKIALKNLKAQNLKITLSDQIHQNDKDCFDRYLKIH